MPKIARTQFQLQIISQTDIQPHAGGMRPARQAYRQIETKTQLDGIGLLTHP